MSFDSAQYLRNPVRLDRTGTMVPHIAEETAPQQTVQTGRLGGMTVEMMHDPASELLDSLEELSMQFEEKATKKLAERKLGQVRARPSAYTEAIDGWMRTLPDMPGREKTEQLLRHLRRMAASGQMPDAEGLRGLLAGLSKDPSHQFALLDILEQALGPEEGALQALLGRTRETLLRGQGGEIRAGINLAAEVNARATTPEEMSALRGLYRSEILGFTTPQDCFRSVLAARGAGALKAAIDFLRAGCGADLASEAPSRDPVALRRILLDLQCVQVLQTVLESLEGLAARMGREFGLRLLLDGEEMTGRVLGFTERSGVYPDELAAFSEACGIRPLPARMDFARELLGLFRRLSPRLFELEDDRLRLIEAAEEHLDGIIAEENADGGGDDDDGKEAGR